jgi:hypothetical protein
MLSTPADPRPAGAETTSLLDLAPFRAAPRQEDPYPWVAASGCLRPDALADPVAEVSPEAGNVFAFVRGEHSWHGHTPFVGERRVVQVTWLRDAAELARKRQRGKPAWWLNGVFGE